MPQKFSDCVQAMTTRLSQLEKSFKRTSSALEVSKQVNYPETESFVAAPDHENAPPHDQESRDNGINSASTISSMIQTHRPSDISEGQTGETPSESPFGATRGQPGHSMSVIEHPKDTITFCNSSLQTNYMPAAPRALMMPQDTGESPQQAFPPSRQMENESVLDDDLDTAPDPEPTGRSSLLGFMADLDRTVRGVGERPSIGRKNTMSVDGPSPSHWGPRDEHDIQVKNAETLVRVNNGAIFRASFDTFFQSISPHHQTFNENEFRSRFDDLVFDGGAGMSPFDKQQFLALVFLVHAETKMLSGICFDPNIVLGWQEFCVANKILSRLLWLGKGNILTLSVLVSKARFLLYMEKFNSAHDTISGAIRLCFQLSIHDQSTWQFLDPYERLMRQRAFWSIFQLDRSVASTSGLPHMIRDNDYNVDLPPPLDDRGIFPFRPLPTATPEQSAAPYTHGIVKWANLHSEVWNAAFGVKATRPLSAETRRSFDEAVERILRELPPHLQWHSDRHCEGPTFVRRQRLSLRLVCIYDDQAPPNVLTLCSVQTT